MTEYRIYKWTHPIVWTNLLFVLSALITKDVWVILSALSLTLGSGLMHRQYSYHGKLFDWFGMYFYPVMIAFNLYGLSDYLTFFCSGLLIFGVIASLADNNKAIAVTMILVCFLKILQSPIVGIIASLIYIGFVYVNYVEQKAMYKDKVHTIKHVFGASGYLFLNL